MTHRRLVIDNRIVIDPIIDFSEKRPTTSNARNIPPEFQIPKRLKSVVVSLVRYTKTGISTKFTNTSANETTITSSALRTNDRLYR